MTQTNNTKQSPFWAKGMGSSAKSRWHYFTQGRPACSQGGQASPKHRGLAPRRSCIICLAASEGRAWVPNPSGVGLVPGSRGAPLRRLGLVTS